MTPNLDPNPMIGGEGGWNEWRYLVLNEIRRLTDGFSRVDDKLDALLRQQDEDRMDARSKANALAKELRDYKEVVDKKFSVIHDTLDNQDTGIVPRVNRIETESVVTEALKKYRGWIVTSIIFLIVSVALPVVKFILDLQK